MWKYEKNQGTKDFLSGMFKKRLVWKQQKMFQRGHLIDVPERTSNKRSNQYVSYSFQTETKL